MVFKGFVVTIIAMVLAAVIAILARKIKTWFLFGEKKKVEKEIDELTAKRKFLQKKMTSKWTNKRECFSQIQETDKQIDEKVDSKRNSQCEIFFLTFSVVILSFLGLLFYKLLESEGKNERLVNKATQGNSSNGEEIDLSDESSNPLTDVPLYTPTSPLTYPPTPTYTPVPTPSPIPTYVPLPTLGPSFIEEGVTIYGDLTQYLGMTAGEVIERIGRPYKYEHHAQNMETGKTGGIWFDNDVLFAFNDSEETLDLSCKVYMIWVGRDAGIAKNIGCGLDATLSGNELANKLGAIYSGPYENMPSGGVSATALCGEYYYMFTWYEEFDDYNPENPPEFISIYKLMNDLE